MSDYIFALPNQNSDLAGHMYFQKKKKKLFAALQWLEHSIGIMEVIGSIPNWKEDF